MPAASGTEARSGPKKRPMKIEGTPHFLHEGLAARQDLGVARQRPHLGDVLLVPVAEPVGDPVAERRTNAAGQPDRPEADAADADQRADRDQRTPGRHQQRDERKRFAECQHQHDRGGPNLIVAHEISQSARKILHVLNAFPARFRR